MSHQRKVYDNKKLKKLYDETQNGWSNGVYFNERKNRYIRYTSHNEWYKTYSRRIIRRKLKNRDYHFQRNEYKKLFDYWWTIT